MADLAESLVKGFVKAFVEVEEGEATGCGGADETPERIALNLRTRDRSILPAGVLKHLFIFSTLRFRSWIRFV